MKPRLQVEVIPVPTADYERLVDEALDALADALAEQFIAKARAQVAAELGVDPDDIDRERGRDAAEALAVLRGGR